MNTKRKKAKSMKSLSRRRPGRRSAAVSAWALCTFLTTIIRATAFSPLASRCISRETSCGTCGKACWLGCGTHIVPVILATSRKRYSRLRAFHSCSEVSATCQCMQSICLSARRRTFGGDRGENNLSRRRKSRETATGVGIGLSAWPNFVFSWIGHAAGEASDHEANEGEEVKDLGAEGLENSVAGANYVDSGDSSSPNKSGIRGRLRRLLKRDRDRVQPVDIKVEEGLGEATNAGGASSPSDAVPSASSSLPEWIKEQQEERERLRKRRAAEHKEQRRWNLENDLKPLEFSEENEGGHSSEEGIQEHRNDLRTSPRIESMMGGEKEIEGIREEEEVQGEDDKYIEDGDDVGTKQPVPPGSLRALSRGGGLRMHLKELLEKAGVPSTEELSHLKSQSAAGDSNVGGAEADCPPEGYGIDEQEDALVPLEPVDMLNRPTKHSSAAYISEKRFQSLAQKEDGRSEKEKYAQWAAFVRKEREVRKMSGLTESTKKGVKEEKGREVASQAGTFQGSITEPAGDEGISVDGDDERSESQGASFAADDNRKQYPSSIDDILYTDDMDDEDFDYMYAADLNKFKPRPVSMSEQRYRSLAKNETARPSEKRGAWELFLKKEQDMRARIGATSIEEEKKEKKMSVWRKHSNENERERQGVPASSSSYLDSLATSTSSVGRSLATDGDVSLNNNDNTSFAKPGEFDSQERRAAYEDFLKKEQEMRSKVEGGESGEPRFRTEGNDFTDIRKPPNSDDNDEGESDGDGDGAGERRGRSEPPPPDTPFFSDIDSRRSVIEDHEPSLVSGAPDWLRKEWERKKTKSDSNVEQGPKLRELEDIYNKSPEDSQPKSASDMGVVADGGDSLHRTSPRRKSPDTPFFEDYIDEDYIEEESENTEVGEEEEDLDRYGRPGAYNIADDDPFAYSKPAERSTFSGYDVRKQNLLEYTELTVEELNLLLEHDPLARLAAINKPDAAFGAIFRFEGLLVDTTELHMAAWAKVAQEHGFDAPLRENVRLAQLMRPDVAVRELFFWTTDVLESRDIALTHFDALQESFTTLMDRLNATGTEEAIHVRNGTNAELRGTGGRVQPAEEATTTFAEIFPVVDGAEEWLDTLRKVDMPCAVVSHLDEVKLGTLLNVTGLSVFFSADKRVSSSNGYERESQEFLGASLRLERRPDHCFVFDTTPSSSIQAHEVHMHAVALMGLYARYDLSTADLTTPSFNDLTVSNVRRLFGDSYEPEVEFQPTKPKPKPRRIRTWIEGDRN